MVLFWWFRKKLGTNIGHNSLNSMLGMLHDVRDKKYKNHDVGAIMGYLKAPKEGPFSKKKVFFLIVTTKVVGVSSNLKWKFLIIATSFM